MDISLYFIRNGPLIINHNSKISEVEKREIANALSDVNLVFARNIESKNSESPNLSIMLYIHLFEKLNKKDFLNLIKIICVTDEIFDYEYYYTGSSVSCILFNYNFQKSSNIFLCEKMKFHKEMKLNKKKLLIEFDSEKDIQLIEKFINPTLSEEVDELLKSENVVIREIFDLQNVLTPLNLKYLDKEYTIGFLYSSRRFACNSLILCLSKDILKNRELFVKLFIHLFQLFVIAGRFVDKFFLKEVDGDYVYLDFRNRKYHKLKGGKIEVEIENLENVFNNITIGFEGEFCFVSKNGDGSYRTVEAKKVITDYLMLMNRYEEIERLLKNYIGIDGARSIGEIRTKVYKIEEDTYKKIAEEIENILSEVKLCAKLNDCEVTYASESYPTGAHFHLGFQDFSKFNSEEQNIIARNFILLLDIVLSSFLETLNTDVRLETCYSNKMNYRIKPYGFEYRTPPSVIFYYDLYKYIFKIFQKIAIDYFKNKYVSLEMENINVSSIEFYRKYIGGDVEKFSEKVCKLRDLINKCYLLTENKTDVSAYKYKIKRFFDELNFDDAELRNILIDLNINYAKDSIVKIFVLTNLDEYATNVENLKFTVNMSLLCKHFPSANPILRDYCIYEVKVGNDFKNLDGKEKKDYFKEVLYNLLKVMEQRGNLKGNADEIIEEMAKRHEILSVSNIVAH